MGSKSASGPRLTPKQRKFAKGYVKTGNATRAAKEAGYSPKTAYSIGSENLTKPEIVSFIEELAAEADTVKGLTIEQLAAMTLREAKGADHAGSRVRALELLLKWKGAFVDRIEDVTKRQDDVKSLVLRIAQMDPIAGASLARALGIAAQDVVSDHDDGSAQGNDAPLTH